MPVDAFDDGATDDRAEGDGEAADGAPGTERDTAPLGGDGGTQDGEREGHDDRRAEALERPRRDQRFDAVREGGTRGGEREDREADREEPAAAEAVTERGTGQQQHGEGERVGVDGPLEALERGVQVVADHGQRHRHDEVVEGDHQQRDGRDGKRPDGQSAGVHAKRSPSWGASDC